MTFVVNWGRLSFTAIFGCIMVELYEIVGQWEAV